MSSDKNDAALKVAKSISKSLSEDNLAARLAIKIALLKSVRKDNWVERIFNSVSSKETS
tara:strand:+ start:1057 stop:1233 length:177 start_codon:yes stop_codon:yes gene_type:complete